MKHARPTLAALALVFGSAAVGAALLRAARPIAVAHADDPAKPAGVAPVASSAAQRLGERLAQETLAHVERVGGEHCGYVGAPAEGWLAYSVLFHSADPVAAFRAAYATASVAGKIYCLAGLRQLGGPGSAAWDELSKDFASKDRGSVESQNGCIVSHEAASTILEKWTAANAPGASAPAELAIRILAATNVVATPKGAEPGLGPESEALAFSCLMKGENPIAALDAIVQRGHTAGRIYGVLGYKLLGDPKWSKLAQETRALDAKAFGAVAFHDGCVVTAGLTPAAAVDKILALEPSSFVAADRVL